jgi:membrane protein
MAPRAQRLSVAPGLWAASKAAVLQWLAHNDARAGAAIAYYSIFSIGPLIVVAISIAALVFDREGVQSQVIDALRSLLGNTAATSIGTMLSGAGSKAEGVFAEAIGTVALVYAAINVVVQLKEAINRVWEVQSSSAVGVWGFVRFYVVSLAAVVALGFLLLTSMLLTAALAAFGKYVGSFLPVAFLQAASFGVSFAAISFLFALMFKWLPDAEVTWRAVWLGAIGTATLFEIGKYVIAFYIGKQGLESKYGAAASVVVVLIWVYYSAQIVLLGAEFTHARQLQQTPPKSAA